VAISLTGLTGALKNALVDLRFGLSPRPATGGIVVVAIDSPSIESVGVWPWPRRVHADLIDKLTRAGAADIHERVDPADDAFFRQMMEKILKTTLEETRATREQSLRRLGAVLAPMQAALKRQAYVCGAEPAYADFILFSVFQWARIMSPQEVLGPEDPLCGWRERVSDLYEGFARNVPVA